MSDPLSIFKRHQPQEKPKWTPPAVPVDNENDDWLASLPSQEYLVPGGKRKFYTIGVLARALQRSPVTIRSWERQGWIPAPGFRTPTPQGTQIPGKESKGRRLYSEAQLRFLYEAYQRFNLADAKKHQDWAGFRRHVKNHYPT